MEIEIKIEVYHIEKIIKIEWVSEITMLKIKVKIRSIHGRYPHLQGRKRKKKVKDKRHCIGVRITMQRRKFS